MRLLAIFSLTVAALLGACASAPLVHDVRVEPAVITPNQDGDADVARISYRIGAPARLSMTLVAEDGTTHVLRDSLPRSPGPHEALFGGVVDGRMLADGTYTLRLDASPAASADGDADGDGSSQELTLSISGGDTDPPRLHGLAVRPDELSPNQDGLGDRVAISYSLDEPTDVRLWLETADGSYVTDILEEQDSGEFAGEPGPHVYDYDAGVDADAPPPPDGEYRIVAEAKDGAGNVLREILPLTIRSGGQPRAAIIGDVEWSDTVLPLGDTLSFTATVRNVSGTPIRTRGPEPGTVYDNDETYNAVAPEAWLVWAASGDERGTAWVDYTDLGDGVAIDLGGADADRGADSGRRAGDDVSDAPSTLCGIVTNGAGPVPAATVAVFESDGDNGRMATTDGDGRFCIADLEPVPEYERTFSRSPGSVRLALEYDDKRTDIAYPFRWQLGATEELEVCQSGDAVYLCLPPGKTVDVHGGVRFVEPPFRRTTTAYLALMHEDVRRMHGPYNPEPISIEH